VKQKRINAVAFWWTKSRGCIFSVPQEDGFFRAFLGVCAGFYGVKFREKAFENNP